MNCPRCGAEHWDSMAKNCPRCGGSYVAPPSAAKLEQAEAPKQEPEPKQEPKESAAELVHEAAAKLEQAEAQMESEHE